MPVRPALLEVPGHFRVDVAVAAVCQRAAENAPLTSQVSKEAIWRIVYGARSNNDDLVERIYGSQDFKNGVRAFLDKRPRTWTGD